MHRAHLQTGAKVLVAQTVDAAPGVAAALRLPADSPVRTEVSADTTSLLHVVRLG